MNEIKAKAERRPLLDWLLLRHPDTPKTRAKQWIAGGRVSVDGEVIRQPHRLLCDPGAGLSLLGRQAASVEFGPGWRLHPRVSLLFLDAAVAIVNKGPGLISVPAGDGALSALSILADFLAGRLRAASRNPRERLPAPYRKLTPLPVHRLDQFTSGVFCLAMNVEARRRLIDQINAHTMGREYIAFVDGRPLAPAGAWRHWVELSEDEMRQEIVSTEKPPRGGSDAVEAVTHYEVIDEFPRREGRCVAKLRLRLETGRKHQIRAQAAHSGLPLLGDRVYHPDYRPGAANGGGVIPFPRQALHAESLTLEHPQREGRRMTWRAELPSDLRELEAALRAGQF